MEASVIKQYYGENNVLHDSVKTLRTNIQFSSIDNELKTLVITSVIPDAGKSTLSSFLGIAMAEGGKKTLLIECDCRHPVLKYYFNMPSAYDMADILSENVTVSDVIAETEIDGLDLLFAAALVNPVEFFGSKRFWAMIEDFKNIYDVIIFDTPPLGSFIEAAILASKSDGSILVMEPGTCEISDTQRVVEQLKKAKARVLGAVFNNVPMKDSNYYYYDRRSNKKFKLPLKK